MKYTKPTTKNPKERIEPITTIKPVEIQEDPITKKLEETQEKIIQTKKITYTKIQT
jgi:hypothetical protein